MLLLWVRVDPGAMAIKGDSVFPKVSGLEACHKIV